MTYSFTDRATYLAASTMWKADYLEHCAKTRKLKLEFKNAQREFSKCGRYEYNWSSVQKEAYRTAHRPVEELRSELQVAAERAREMVSIRHGMKEEAQNQYLSAKSIA
jgi:hypothetical protein